MPPSRAKSFILDVAINPASLSVNVKNLTNDHLPRSVTDARSDLIYEIKKHLIIQDGKDGVDLDWLDGAGGKIFSVRMEFGFLSDRSDIDGPIKRVIDSLARAIVARGYHWNDSMIYDLKVMKYLTKHPSIQITVEEME